jgi:hypothetical protein
MQQQPTPHHRGGKLVSLGTTMPSPEPNGPDLPVFAYVPDDDAPASDLPGADANLRVGDCVIHDVIGPGIVTRSNQVNGRTVVVDFAGRGSLAFPIPNSALHFHK